MRRYKSVIKHGLTLPDRTDRYIVLSVEDVEIVNPTTKEVKSTRTEIRYNGRTVALTEEDKKIINDLLAYLSQAYPPPPLPPEIKNDRFGRENYTSGT